MVVVVVQVNDEGDGRVEWDDAWLMTSEAMVTSFCQSADNVMAMMQQHNDKALVTNHLRLRHDDVIEFRVSCRNRS